MFVRNIFHTAHHGGKEWIRNVRHDHDHDIGLVPPQASGQLARLIAKATNRIQYPLPQFLPNLRRIVDDVRHRADGHFSSFRNLPHCYWRIHRSRITNFRLADSPFLRGQLHLSLASRPIYSASSAQRKPSPPERSILGAVIKSFPCSPSLYACGKYQIEP